MAAKASSNPSAKQKPTKPPPPAMAVSLASSALTATLTPLFAFETLSKLLPVFGLAINEYTRPALKLALQEVERFYPPVQLANGYAQREVIALNRDRRAGYVVAATKRIATALEQANGSGEAPEAALASARANEDRYLNQHARASAQRVIVASSIDALANQYGSVLGWYARHDNKTTPECLDADGKNFRVDNPPDIGYPGIVHMECRCRAGVPHPNAEELSGGISTIAAANAYSRRRTLELASVSGHHVAGTPFTYRHGWNRLDPSASTAAIPLTFEHRETVFSHQVTAYDEAGNKAGYIEWHKHSPNHPLAVTKPNSNGKKFKRGEIFDLKTEPTYRRKGVASSMVQVIHANKLSPSPKHSTNQTGPGAAWARSVALAQQLEFVRHVRTASGVARFDEPIGTPITAEMEHEAEFKKAAAKAHRNATSRVKRTGTTVTQQRGAADRLAVRADDARKTQGQTRSNFVHPFTGKPMTKTEIGDTYEELFERHGAELLAKKFPGQYSAISGEGGGARNTPLDFQLNHTFGGELKTLSSRSENQKTAIKKDEIDRKLNALTGNKLKPLLVVQVVDQDTGTIQVYAFPNFVSKAIKAMEYVGSYKYNDEQFKQAQMARRQWKGGV